MRPDKLWLRCKWRLTHIATRTGDTQKCAFKCCSIVVNGEEREVFKDPITDPGKKSKKGRLTLEMRYVADFFAHVWCLA
jgi:hypothetical protein